MRSEGRIFQRGKVWWIAYFVRGKEVRESGGKTEREANNRLKQRFGEIYANRFVGPIEERVTVGELLDALAVHLKTKGAKAVSTFVCHMKPVRAVFGAIRAAELAPHGVENFIQARLGQGLARATVNREVGVLKQAYRLAYKQGRMARVPYFPMLKEDNARQGFFERAEFEAVAAGLPEVIADVARFAYLSGWRKGEILPLGWSAVNRQAREVRLATSKNGRPRVLPLVGSLWHLIEKRWGARSYLASSGAMELSPFVFHNSGMPLGEFRKSWAAACKAAGCPGRLFHDLRRSAIRNMVQAGVPQSVAMSISGHRTVSVFTRYAIASEDDKRRALEQTQTHLEGEPLAKNIIPMDLTPETRTKHGHIEKGLAIVTR
jgi:integrase